MSGGSPRRPGWRIGRIGSVPVYLAPSWLLVAALLTFLFLPTIQSVAPNLSQPVAIAAASSFPILLFVSVFLHELAHGGVATLLHVRVREYVLTFWGGHTSFSSDLRSPGVSAAVSAAGPVANLLLAGAGWLVLRSIQPSGFGWVSTDPSAPRIVAVVLVSLVWANLVVALFNLLPGNPLDGGRILEALIWKVTGNKDLGAIGAGWVGRVIAVGIALWFVVPPLAQGRQPSLTGVVWALLIASVVWRGASRSIEVGRARRSAAGFDLRPLLVPAAVVEASAMLAQVPPVPWGVRSEHVVLLDPSGGVVGVADRATMAQVPASLHATTPVTAAARALPPDAVVTLLTGADALAQVAQGLRVSSTLVAVSSHGVLGTLERDALVAALGGGR